MNNKEHRTISLTPEQHRRLRTLSWRTRVPVAVFIREGIDLVLEKRETEEDRKALRKLRLVGGSE